MPVSTQVRVRYAETDQMGVVYHANYFVWFEVGRVEFLRALGFDYRNLEIEHDCILPVVDVNCRYRAPARYDDRIEIVTRPVVLRGSVLKFGYRLYRLPGGLAGGEAEDRALLAEGETAHVVCDRRMRKKRLPAQHENAVRAAMELPR